MLGSAQHFYIHVEKRSLPLEASKALVNTNRGKGSRDVALSLLEKTKKLLPKWIGDSSQVQIYKRFFGYLLRKEALSLAECTAPFVLINGWESFYEVFIKDRKKRKEAFWLLKEFFGNLHLETFLEKREPSELLKSLMSALSLPQDHDFYVATHIAYMLNPHAFMPVTYSVGRAINLNDVEGYFRLMDSLRQRKIKTIEAYSLLHLFYENVPSKRSGVDLLLGIDREIELLKLAEKLWNAEEFYSAHEVLEDVWEHVKDKEKRGCYQGLIRFAIALHHYKSGEPSRARNVLRKAVAQMKACRCNLPLNLRELASRAEDILHKLNNDKPVDGYPRFRVV